MSQLSAAEAERVLAAHAPAGESWPRHCHQVARVARTVAEALLDAGTSLDDVLDPWWTDGAPTAVAPVTVDQLCAWALVHDIGRSRDHGPLHGWVGYQLLAELGHAATARGCLTHWIKGRSRTELEASAVPAAVLAELETALAPRHWRLADSVMSFADSSVAGTAIVPLDQRHADLRARYGGSVWMDRHEELGNRHAAQISSALGTPVADLIRPLYDAGPDHG